MGDARVFTNARNVRIENSSLAVTTNIYGDSVRNSSIKVLHQHVALNAINNDGGRADEPKCHPGTRLEVIGLIEKWVDDCTSPRLLWLSGPAGGGKTAIVKTVTERSAARGVRTANFFFFRADSTRCHTRAVVPTLLYQIIRHYPQLSSNITEILDVHPLILDTGISEQCTIIGMLGPVIRRIMPTGASIVLVIDGLDECDVGYRDPGDLIRAFSALVLSSDSPYRLFVASRPDAHIQMTMNQLPTTAQSIFLDEQYLPESDIRRFVTDEFSKIRSTHPMAKSLPHDWPSVDNVKGIVAKSSGQFIYAATVMRFVADPSTSPYLGLQQIQGVAPAPNSSPFRYLDAIYTFILSQSNDPDAARDILSIHFVTEGANHDVLLLSHYNPRYTQHVLESCVSGLSSIISVTGAGNVDFYHASFRDFLVDPSRAGPYCIDPVSAAESIFLALWDTPPIFDPDNGVICQRILLMHLPRPVPPRITRLLCSGKYPEWTTYLWPEDGRPGRDFLDAVWFLYVMGKTPDPKTYKQILNLFIPILMTRYPSISPRRYDVEQVSEYMELYRQYGVFFRMYNSISRLLTK